MRGRAPRGRVASRCRATCGPIVRATHRHGATRPDEHECFPSVRPSRCWPRHACVAAKTESVGIARPCRTRHASVPLAMGAERWRGLRAGGGRRSGEGRCPRMRARPWIGQGGMRIAPLRRGELRAVDRKIERRIERCGQGPELRAAVRTSTRAACGLGVGRHIGRIRRGMIERLRRTDRPAPEGIRVAGRAQCLRNRRSERLHQDGRAGNPMDDSSTQQVQHGGGSVSPWRSSE